jgi:transcriptional regulator with XRE-family HTH domain
MKTCIPRVAVHTRYSDYILDITSDNRYNDAKGGILMYIEKLLIKRKMTKYRLAKISGVSQTTVSDIFSGKVCLKNCTGDTLYRLAKALGVSVDFLLSEYCEHRSTFEVYKSNICHYVKSLGDIDFIISIIKSDIIYRYMDMWWHCEALYLLAMVDYLCRVNDLPLYEEYEELRGLKMPKIIYPAGILILSAVMKNNEPKERSLREAIPEFLRHNIVESEVRNIA